MNLILFKMIKKRIKNHNKDKRSLKKKMVYSIHRDKYKIGSLLFITK